MEEIPPYAELVCASNFSFLTGASHPQELVARAAELGYSAVAITDECSMAGVVRALEETQRCAERGCPIPLIPGSSFRLENGSRLVLQDAGMGTKKKEGEKKGGPGGSATAAVDLAKPLASLSDALLEYKGLKARRKFLREGGQYLIIVNSIQTNTKKKIKSSSTMD